MQTLIQAAVTVDGATRTAQSWSPPTACRSHDGRSRWRECRRGALTDEFEVLNGNPARVITEVAANRQTGITAAGGVRARTRR